MLIAVLESGLKICCVPRSGIKVFKGSSGLFGAPRQPFPVGATLDICSRIFLTRIDTDVAHHSP